MKTRWIWLLAVFGLWGPAVYAQAPTKSGDLTATASSCTVAGGQRVSLGLGPSDGSATVTLSGTFTATAQFQASNDDQATFDDILGLPLDSQVMASTGDAEGTWTFRVPALTTLCVRLSAYTSGTVSVTIRSSTASAGLGGGGATLGASAGGFSVGSIPGVGTGPVWEESNASYDANSFSILGADPASILIQNSAAVNTANTSGFTLDVKSSTQMRTAAQFAGSLSTTTDASRTGKLEIKLPSGGTFGTTVTFQGRNATFAGGVYGATCATFTDQDTTPDVSGGNCFKTANTMATTITALDGLVNGQTVTILVNDTNTSWSQAGTIVLNSSGTLTTTAADVLVFQGDGTSANQQGFSAGQLQSSADGAARDSLINNTTSFTQQRWEESYICADSGGDDTYSCAQSPVPTSYNTNDLVILTVTTTNTGTATLDPDGGGALTAKTITRRNGATLLDGDLVVTTPHMLFYDGTNYVCLDCTITGVPGADDQVLVSSSSTVTAWKSVADCDDSSGNHLNYDTGTNAFSCGTSSSGSGVDALTFVNTGSAQNSTRYFNLGGASTTESLVRLPSTISGTGVSMYCYGTVANGQTSAHTFYHNGSSTALTCTITGGASGTGQCSVTGQSVAITAGNNNSIETVNSATSGTVIGGCSMRVTGAS